MSEASEDVERVLIAAAIVVVVVAVALIVRHRRRPDAPTQGRGTVPAQLDRDDFARPEVAWLVAVFTSMVPGQVRLAALTLRSPC